MHGKTTKAVIAMFVAFVFLAGAGIVLNDDVKDVKAGGSGGNTLYVGGSGPNNYTKIQDAVDNASDGDTVYVFNGTYYENVFIGRSINLIGENKDTTIIDGGGNSEDIKNRIKQIKKQIENTDSDFDKEKLQERLAKLSGGIAVIKVGAATEVEQKEKQHRVEDAVRATKAALEEGVVPGGGVALLRSSKVLESVQVENEDEKVGVNIVLRALEEPIRQIAVNAGQSGEVVLEEAKKRQKHEGFDVTKGEFIDMLKAGIVDPTKVTRSALENAASVSSMLLTTKVVVTDIPEKKDNPGMPQAPMMPQY